MRIRVGKVLTRDDVVGLGFGFEPWLRFMDMRGLDRIVFTPEDNLIYPIEPDDIIVEEHREGR